MKKINRRDFLKISGASAAALAVLTGCGPAARYVTRRPYADMPEYNQTGASTFFATTCLECPAGCGLIVRTQEGRAIKIEGNPAHPVNQGKLCPRGLTGVQGLYNPDRIKAPALRGAELDWDTALAAARSALLDVPAAEVAFLVGMAPDHLFDLLSELAKKLGAPAPVRMGALNMLDPRATLVRASAAVFGQPALPLFDIGGADLVVSFGANFLESWLSPLAYSRGFRDLRKGKATGRRGQLICFDARQSVTTGMADLWLPAVPGGEAAAAQALGKLIEEQVLHSAAVFKAVDYEAALAASGLSAEKMEAAAALLLQVLSRPGARVVFLPGGPALTGANGLLAARSILALNSLTGSVGVPGGVSLVPVQADEAPFAAVQELAAKMSAGQVKSLFIFGCNPVFELPAALGFEAALQKVPLSFSFASFPDETSRLTTYVLPDHTPLEAWGYQRVLAGSDRPIVSSVQPVSAPLYNTRAAADVLLAAAYGVLPYKDVVDFIQQKITPYISAGGTFSAPEILTFWSLFLQHGGWWKAESEPVKPTALRPSLTAAAAPPAAGDKLHLLVYPGLMGDGSGANRPWLQETPSPMTTVMWNTWVEIHPETAAKLGIKDDDVVRIQSAAGEIEAVAYLYPAIRPDTIAIPFGQGHTALGRYAEKRGANPARLLELILNEAGDLASAATLVSVTPTGAHRPIARAENRKGVYDEGH